MSRTKVAIIGSGNIGTDLMIKVIRLSEVLEVAAFVGIDPESDGLKRAERMGVPVTAGGIDGLVAMPGFGEIAIVFDATSAAAHLQADLTARRPFRSGGADDRAAVGQNGPRVRRPATVHRGDLRRLAEQLGRPPRCQKRVVTKEEVHPRIDPVEWYVGVEHWPGPSDCGER
ncbi:hypothetical protein ASG29_06665 [Sphingomonas sp. Leaf412]|nr:hypothetical protein ASG29_06665 [Sphingomonas sp. Leaf412]